MFNLHKFFEESGTAQKRSKMTLKEVDTFLNELTKLTKEDEQVAHFKELFEKSHPDDVKWIWKIIDHDLNVRHFFMF